jgi:hypothetical protein
MVRPRRTGRNHALFQQRDLSEGDPVCGKKKR